MAPDDVQEAQATTVTPRTLSGHRSHHGTVTDGLRAIQARQHHGGNLLVSTWRTVAENAADGTLSSDASTTTRNPTTLGHSHLEFLAPNSSLRFEGPAPLSGAP